MILAVAMPAAPLDSLIPVFAISCIAEESTLLYDRQRVYFVLVAFYFFE